MSTDRLSVRLTAELQEQLGAIVRATGKTEAEVVRNAIAEYCRRHDGVQPTCYDLAAKAKIVGCVDGAPADLSSNPQHLDGFGGG